MKFVMPSNHLMIVAVVVGSLAALPMFVVLAAQSQITEVNQSGMSSVKGIVSGWGSGRAEGPLDCSEDVLESDEWSRPGKSA